MSMETVPSILTSPYFKKIPISENTFCFSNIFMATPAKVLALHTRRDGLDYYPPVNARIAVYSSIFASRITKSGKKQFRRSDPRFLQKRPWGRRKQTFYADKI